MDRRDELAWKIANRNERQRTRHEIQKALDELVRRGLVSYDEETGEYTRLATDEEWERKMDERE